MMASALTIMSGATIAPALPSIEAHFSGTPHAELLTRLVLTMPALFIVLCAPFAGLVVDRLGRKPVLVAAAALFALAGVGTTELELVWDSAWERPEEDTPQVYPPGARVTVPGLSLQIYLGS